MSDRVKRLMYSDGFGEAYADNSQENPTGPQPNTEPPDGAVVQSEAQMSYPLQVHNREINQRAKREVL